jgi:hypothetical protein
MLHLTRNLNRRFDQGYAEARLGELGIPLVRKAGDMSGSQQAQLTTMAYSAPANFIDTPCSHCSEAASTAFAGRPAAPIMLRSSAGKMAFRSARP